MGGSYYTLHIYNYNQLTSQKAGAASVKLAVVEAPHTLAVQVARPRPQLAHKRRGRHREAPAPALEVHLQIMHETVDPSPWTTQLSLPMALQSSKILDWKTTEVKFWPLKRDTPRVCSKWLFVVRGSKFANGSVPLRSMASFESSPYAQCPTSLAPPPAPLNIAAVAGNTGSKPMRRSSVFWSGCFL